MTRGPGYRSAVLVWLFGAGLLAVACGGEDEEGPTKERVNLPMTVEFDREALAGQPILEMLERAQDIGQIRVVTFTSWPPFGTHGAVADPKASAMFMASVRHGYDMVIAGQAKQRVWVYAGIVPRGATKLPPVGATVATPDTDEAFAAGLCDCDDPSVPPETCQRTCVHRKPGQGIPSVDLSSPYRAPVVVRINRDIK